MTLRLAIASTWALLAVTVVLPAHADDGDPEWLPFEPAAIALQPTTTLNRASTTTRSASVTTSSYSATGKSPWDEYDKHVQASGVIGTLGPDLFGDTVEYYKNTLSFSVTDISLPGNFALPVALTRKLTVADRRAFYGAADHPLIDWDLDIPNISGVYAPNWGDTRCSSNAPSAPNSVYNTGDFWNGLTANMPGGGELLLPITDDPATAQVEAAPAPTGQT